MDTLEVFETFIDDHDAPNMYISGQAGTGKTTDLNRLVQYCIDNNIEYTACSYTHKACGILADKLPKNAVIRTLHSFLTKRPITNEHAVHVKQLNRSVQQGTPESTAVLFIDEYSMIGEQDYMDIGDTQLDKHDKLAMKVVYIGDKNQLPPVGDIPAIIPHGKYNVKLTKVYRQANTNPLLDTLTVLVNYIEGAKPEPLVEHSTFIRGTDLKKTYDSLTNNKILLAYTNRAVQYWNKEIQEREKPVSLDAVFSPTIKDYLLFIQKEEDVKSITMPFNDEELGLGSKYKTLEHLKRMPGISFATLEDDFGVQKTYAYIFGHYDYKVHLEELGTLAVKTNKSIESTHNKPAKVWAYNNKNSILAKKRAAAWRDYLTFKNCVICIDFTHALTVHKSQGSTFESVVIDTNDLGICADNNYILYLRLLYVAISRASDNVYTN